MTLTNILYTIVLLPLVELMVISFKIFDKLFDNTGIAIIGVSLTVTLLCLPLYIVAENWQQVERDTQAKLKPGITRIKSTFKGDEQYMILSTFYKQNHYHPMMALRSSFGLLIQIPFFMAAYSCLSNMSALQNESFLFIKNMGEQDALFHIGVFPINVLPIAMTIINIIAGAIYTKGFAFKEKIQIYGMALIFLVFLYSSPAGLVLYWTMNNIFSLIKNIFYKLKNPLGILYGLMVASCLFISIFILFIYDGGASAKKRVEAVVPMLLLIGIPFYIKTINWILSKYLINLQKNKSLRFKLFLFSALGLTVLTGFVLPSNLISSSVQEFSNIENYTTPLDFLAAPFLQSVGLFIVWPLCIYFLFGKKIQTLLSALFSFMLISFAVNSFAFSGNYGSMDITLQFIGGIESQSNIFIIINLFTNIALALFVLIICRKQNSLFTNFILIAFVSFTLLGIVNSRKIGQEYKNFQTIHSKSENENNKFKKYIHLSKTNKNVIFIMLDRAESTYFPHIIENFPKLNEKLTGFTYYPNTVSCNGHTLMASPALYGGYEYTPDKINYRKDELLKDKHNEALMVMPRIFTEQADFNVMLADLSWANYSYIADMNFIKKTDKINPMTLKGRYTGEFKKKFHFSKNVSLVKCANRNLLWVSFFREGLALLRPVIYYKGSWWGEKETSAEDTDLFIDMYAPLYFITDIIDFDSDKSSFTLITNEATHSDEKIPFLDITKEINHFSSDLPGYDIQVASIMKIADLVDFLKVNEVYDNTRIIVVAVHGIGYGDTAYEKYDNPKLKDGTMKDHFNPLFLVKDFDSHKNLATDNSFMTNADSPSIACKDIIKTPVNPFTGKELSIESKKHGIFVTTENFFMPHHSKSKYTFTVKNNSWYRVNNNIFIDSNWTQEIPND